jgi:hypothetical protein
MGGGIDTQIRGKRGGSKVGSQLALFLQISSAIFPGEGIQTFNSTLPGIIAAVVNSRLERSWSIEEIFP